MDGFPRSCGTFWILYFIWERRHDFGGKVVLWCDTPVLMRQFLITLSSVFNWRYPPFAIVYLSRVFLWFVLCCLLSLGALFLFNFAFHRCNLFRMPVEIWHSVCDSLSVQDIFCLSHTSHLMHELIQWYWSVKFSITWVLWPFLVPMNNWEVFGKWCIEWELLLADLPLYNYLKEHIMKSLIWTYMWMLIDGKRFTIGYQKLVFKEWIKTRQDKTELGAWRQLSYYWRDWKSWRIHNIILI